MKRIAVLGATGSIGTSCLEVIARHAERLQAVALSTHRQWELLAEQCRKFLPHYAIICDGRLRERIDRSRFPRETELLFGPEALEQIASSPDVDTVVAGIVGAAGLRSSYAAVKAGKRVALANKETLVIAGHLVMQAAQASGAELIPVDSEHSAVYQSMLAGKPQEISRIVLTASGGPFRGKSRAQLEAVTVDQALVHPTWNMGRKITIDSATMMNKALEVIEARWLFGLPAGQLSVVIHPQSLIHSLVEYVDGSVVCQLSPPDMKLPIQYALSWPERWSGLSPRMDWGQATTMEFLPPDLDAFPALRLGFEAAEKGGTCGAVLNGAKEAAVERFLNGTLTFLQIADSCREVLAAHDFHANPDLDVLLQQDAWARQEIERWTP